MKRRTIALFGAGTHGLSAVLPALLHLRQGLELVAVVEPWKESRDRAAGAAPGVKVYETSGDLYGDQAPDIVYIATLPHLHLPVALEAFEHGCHVVCEKPLAPTVEECDRMVDAARRADRHLVTMFENRYKTRNRQIRAWALSGQLGRIEAIHLQHFWPGPIAEPRRTHLLDASGALDCGIHYLDLARFFVDGGDWETVHAAGRWFEEPNLKNPPHLAITATLEGGALVTLTESMSYRLAYAKRTGDRSGISSVHLVGTEGIVESIAGGVRLHRSDDSEAFCADEPSTHADEIPWVIADLLSLLETGRAESGFLPTGQDGRTAQWITAQANQQANSARSRRSETEPKNSDPVS